ncbi:MAG: hypothetical protein HN736_07805 [Anaerolineae bacterium]|jgi:hypothetical protein|nr:hypothetical protein [Anaerolineae bacterium]MBT3714554.1 hypothetical protein [Anaerolineae bacterium]MBT4311758.1 hypothetical protein [Anaerolineae bacterium]MBT4457314.1 hypothetical protein [Anaerolineae bacterium]MBT4843431.1 hypothetical protein [Anaerolineae bacterium]
MSMLSPYISVAKRGYECSTPLHKVFNYILYKLHRLPIGDVTNRAFREGFQTKRNQLSCGLYHHYRKWSKDGSLENLWGGSILSIKDDLNLSKLHLDGTHAITKKGGESVAYQGRKDVYFLGTYFIAFAMVNLRHVIQQ